MHFFFRRMLKQFFTMRQMQNLLALKTLGMILA